MIAKSRAIKGRGVKSGGRAVKAVDLTSGGGREPRRRIAPQAIARLKAKVRELTRRTGGQSPAQVAKELSRYLIGWRGYFGFCETPSVLRSRMQPQS